MAVFPEQDSNVNSINGKFLDKRWESSACGKAIIVGEHAAIHGATAIAIPLHGLQVELSLEDESEKNLNNFSDKLAQKIQDKNFSFNFSALLKKAYELLEEKYIPLPLKIQSNILIGSGLGSSAALCVSLLKFLSKYYNKNLSLKQIAYFANELEKMFHGNPSGLDTTVISFEKPVIFRRGSPPSFIQFSSLANNIRSYQWPFVIIDTGERTPTHLMVEKTRQHFLGEAGQRKIAEFNKMANQVIEAFTYNYFSLMSTTINAAATALETLGIVNERSKKITDQVLALGVPAIKVTGSGGGGCLLALLDPEKVNEQFIKLIKLLGKDKVYKIYL